MLPMFQTTCHNTAEQVIDCFEPISLQEMDNVSLLNRTDTKFVLNTNQLWHILTQINDHYRVLTINQRRINSYQTLYFDTPNFMLYMQHHNGQRGRYKVRCRKYVDTNVCYLEVKLKTNKDNTVKNRLRIPEIITVLEEDTRNFMRDHFPFESQLLKPKSRNNFERITLVSRRNVERLTIDLNLNFKRDGAGTLLPGIVIAEVKQERFSLNSDFMQQMRAMHLYSTGFSKYCIGTAILYPHLKRNRFKPILILINKLCGLFNPSTPHTDRKPQIPTKLGGDL